MSAESAAPVAPAPESTTEPTTPKATPAEEKPSPKSRYAQKQETKAAAVGSLKEFLKAKLAEDADEEPAKPTKKPEPKAEPKPEKKAEPAKSEPKAATKDEPSAQAEKLADKIEEAGGDAPDQKAGESDKQYELRLAKTLRDLREAKAEALKARKEAEASGTELKKLQRLLDGGKANPLTVLEHLGVSYEDLTKGILEEKYKPAHKRNDLPPEVLEKIERLEAAEKAREAEKVQQQAIVQRKADEDLVRKYIEDNADEYPLASAVGWAARNIVTTTYEKKLDPAGALEALQALEADLADNVAGMLGSDRSIKALLKKQPRLKDAVIAALGLEERKDEPEERETAPRTVAEVETGATGKKLSKAELKARTAAELRQRLRAQRDED